VVNGPWPNGVGVVGNGPMVDGQCVVVRVKGHEEEVVVNAVGGNGECVVARHSGNRKFEKEIGKW
jgi:hypothetical protein